MEKQRGIIKSFKLTFVVSPIIIETVNIAIDKASPRKNNTNKSIKEKIK